VLGQALRSLDPRLPRTVWTMEVGGFLNAFGNGIVFPFLLIYLHNVRGIGLGTAGLVLAANNAAGLVTTPLAGSLVDRIGGRATLAGALIVQATGFVSFPLVHHPWQAFLAAAVAGVGDGGFWPTQSTLLAGLTPAPRRHAAYALQRVTRNFGIGIGGVLGGLIAITSQPTTFTVLFSVDAATFLAFAVVLIFVPEPELEVEPDAVRGRYLDVIRDRVFLGVVGLNVLFVAGGYAML
jgi:MFS family permease